MQKKRYWKWVCEFCFKQSNHNILPSGWDLVWQSAVCPNCQKRVANDGGYFVVKGGAYAGTRRDPRIGTTTRAVDLLDSSANSALVAQPANH